jgi:hypothetical protein
MTPQRIAEFVDEAVAKFDASTLGPDYSPGSTSTWRTIVCDWQRFKALVDRVDRAVREPLTPGATRSLIAARLLVHADAYRLAFWLPHVASALKRHARHP